VYLEGRPVTLKELEDRVKTAFEKEIEKIANEKSDRAAAITNGVTEN
jgi:hypothetical protein